MQIDFIKTSSDRVIVAPIIAAHNHPSGNLEPSPQDREITRRLQSAGEIPGVPLLDHVILSHCGYLSFLEKKMI